MNIRNRRRFKRNESSVVTVRNILGALCIYSFTCGNSEEFKDFNFTKGQHTHAGYGEFALKSQAPGSTKVLSVECELPARPLQGQDLHLSISIGYSYERNGTLLKDEEIEALYFLYQVNYNAVVTEGVDTKANSNGTFHATIPQGEFIAGDMIRWQAKVMV
ncbi:hypothetical protein CEUSTIGMA_g2579.t1 [Chlamydomonas eustigma]|uniref:Uncharacterized protein n=1 Tax=Chlamydomonas eustigma TaxID=1157962 RepID=A0A250WWG2_9CHLO|nr:hypothetical protein CEUSTIGMA_g2579.t1 [Chlamydomonas eustigma]|eukprot:GAX75135.1 hypothetical protein CEUSTIGMA_g2579.t1 [Chlamydomonas eustigma]